MNAGGELVVPDTGGELSSVGSEVGSILQTAVAAGTGVAELREIVALYKEVRGLEAEAQLEAAAGRAQARLENIPRTKTVEVAHRDGTRHGWRFAPFEVIAEYARPILASEGLRFRFDTEVDESGRKWTVCFLSHSLGASQSARVEDVDDGGRSKMSGSQRAQSAHSYAKRQALSDVLGIATEDDDDAEGRRPSGPITEEQHSALRTFLDEVPDALPDLLAWAGVDTLPELPSHKYEDALRSLRARLAMKENPPEPAE